MYYTNYAKQTILKCFVCLYCFLFTESKYYAELPKRIKALSGSCVHIPCTFKAPETIMKNTEHIFSCWIKKNQAFLHPESLVVFNGSSNIIRGFHHIEILGNLSQRECTTVFYDVMNNHTDNYYFRVEMKNPDWKNTYQYNPINISVSGKLDSTVNYICSVVTFFKILTDYDSWL